jgi:hypothetical protein
MQNIFINPSDISIVEPRAGGWCWAVLIKREDVETWPFINPLTGTITDNLVMKSGTSFYRIQALEKDRYFREGEKNDPGGVYNEVAVNAIVSGNSTQLLLSLQTMRFHEWVILVNDRVDMIRMVGDEDAGARFLRSYDSATLDGQRQHVLQFAWQSQLPCPVYESLTVTIGGVSVDLPPYVVNVGSPTNARITEDGFFRVTEDGSFRIIE